MIPQGQPGDGHATHERRDVDVLSLLLIGGLLLLILGLSFLVCAGILKSFNRAHEAQERRARVPMLAKEKQAFPEPLLLINPGREWTKTRRDAAQQLDTYGWIDRSADVAHIPIGRAMQLLVERGLPEVGAGQTRLQLMQAWPATDAQPNEPITSPAPEATP